MTGIDNEFLRSHRNFRIKSKKMSVAFPLFALTVAIIVFWCLKLVGITVTGDAFCGLNEHIHSDECYSISLTCGSAQAAEAEKDSPDAHSHTDACYEKTLVCPLKEHTHSAECFPDKSADTEEPEDWLKSFENVTVTTEPAQNLLSIALTQVGYKESTLNYEFDSQGNKTGYTRYGEWYGNPYGNWDAMFVSFCLNYAKIKNYDELISMSAVTMQEKWETCLIYENADEHIAKTGELVFLDKNEDGKTDTVAIISEIGDEIKIISGDSNDSVEISLLDKNQAVGYGLTGKLSCEAAETTSEVTETQATTEAVIFEQATTEAVTGETAPADITEGTSTTQSAETTLGSETTQTVTSEAAATTDKAEAQTTLTSQPQADATQPHTDSATADSSDTQQEASEDQTDTTKEPVNEAELTDSEWDSLLAEYEKTLDPSVADKIQKLSPEDKREALLVMYYTDKLPSADEFYSETDRLYEADDVEAEEEYIKTVQKNMILAYAHFQCVEAYAECICNLDKMLEIQDIFSNFNFSTFTSGTSFPLKFHYVNRGWSEILPIVIYGGSAAEKITTGSNVNQYWHGIVVDYNASEGYYYVSDKYVGGSSTSATTVRNLEPSTSKGFVIFVWMADSTSSTALQQSNAAIAKNVAVGDRVTVSKDPTTLSSGYSSSGYGTVTFSEYIPEAEETEEDLEWYKDTAEASDSQINDGGGRIISADKKVITTKTINGTSEENVFDITLTVQTQTDIQTFLSEPDMAVVIVMDISNTMNSKYPSGSTTSRYDAAVVAAESFMKQFANETSGLSKIGFVAFNTHAHDIISLQPCTTNNVNSLISEMKTDTRAIIKATGYADSHERFTNVEAGLKRGYDMLKNSGNANQYIIFLSDGFPTTYLKDNSDTSTSYEGYDPYTSSGTKGADGVFYDYVTGYYCSAGTSYSDKASIRARVMANKIKNAGTKIFSIGVDVGGQKISGYEMSGLSVIDRTSTTYEIGSASSTSAYTNWLKNSIGSGYYYDSTNQTEINNAFTQIFSEIRQLNQQSTKTIWTATDPMPVYDDYPSVVGFIHFYDKDGDPLLNPSDPENITGIHEENGENTANHTDNIVYWDLKKSGYTTTKDPDNSSITYYHYSLKYRVRLVNEKDAINDPFIEGTVYQTNGEAYLEYRNITTNNDIQQISDLKTVSFSKPAVHGYLSGFGFTKANALGIALPGAEFTLRHDDGACTLCHGDGTAITDSDAHDSNYKTDHFAHRIGPFVSVSDENGYVSFTNIPSGHIYTLTETVVPPGYVPSKNSYSVTVAYDELTVTETLPDGTEKIWTGKNDVITNVTVVYVLPETGGPGTLLYTIIGICLTAFPILYSIIRRKRERRLT